MSAVSTVHMEDADDTKDEPRDSDPSKDAAPKGPQSPTAPDAAHDDDSPHAPGASVDDVLHYMQAHSSLHARAAAVDVRALRKRVDKRIVPIMFLCYTAHFVDRSLLNVRCSLS